MGELKVVGAGLGRTGTLSLKAALEQLIGGRCYHMLEVFANPGHITHWRAAARGDAVDWSTLLADYDATVDWPAAAMWRPLADAYPDAIVLLSHRPADDWWRSADRTIFEFHRRREGDPGDSLVRDQLAMTRELLEATFAERFLEEGPAKAAFERHNAEVRATVSSDRLVEWEPGDGWGPLCTALGVTVPDEEFPHSNSTEDFRRMVDLGD